MSHITTSRIETLSLGERLAGLLRLGDVLLLTGPLGAGKSEFARGVARGLGVSEPVSSPTFTLLNVYQTAEGPLHHFDWYRIQDAEEIYAAGLDEYIGGDCLTLIEWHERAPELLPGDCLEVVMEPVGENARRVSFIRRGGFRAMNLSESLKRKSSHDHPCP